MVMVQGQPEVGRPLVRAWVTDLDVLVDRVALVDLDVVGKLSSVGVQGIQQTSVLGLEPVDLFL